jgi:serine/threonine protein kinase
MCSYPYKHQDYKDESVFLIILTILYICSGYMSPEYAIEGRYSTKSDVFSYGVLLLEIIAGQRNTHCETGIASPNLIGHVSYINKKSFALNLVNNLMM